MRFLVDTGATSVALSERHAATLRWVAASRGRQAGQVGTAVVVRWVTDQLASLSVGESVQRRVRAVVIDGDKPAIRPAQDERLIAVDIDQRENLPDPAQ